MRAPRPPDAPADADAGADDTAPPRPHPLPVIGTSPSDADGTDGTDGSGHGGDDERPAWLRDARLIDPGAAGMAGAASGSSAADGWAHGPDGRRLPPGLARRRQAEAARSRPWHAPALKLAGMALIGASLALPLTLRQPDVPVEALVDRWALPPSSFIDLDGQLIHWREEGPVQAAGAPLLLLHDLGAHLQVWDDWSRALRPQRRVLRMDLPGHGLTGPWSVPPPGLPAALPPADPQARRALPGEQADGSADARAYRADVLARAVLAVIERQQLPPVVLVGHGLGGEVAWHLAALAPQRVRALVLLAPSGGALPGGGPRLSATPPHSPLAWQLLGLPAVGLHGEDTVPRWLVAQTLHQLAGDPTRVTDAQIDRYRDLLRRRGDRAVLHALARAEAGGTQPPALPALGAAADRPTLLLWGGRDRWQPPSQATPLRAALPQARLAVLPDLGHLLPEESGAAGAAVLQDFLRTHGL
ncbi:alpha/beta fold hydrolase [Pseudaquabacterium rugosum]|uniref:Alpha/beta fold hydrolase n=1 Tax=Pseudaquabacterium rugosum TaxID=2984194 RepID=A0ABU9B9V5_9BURK